ncbi:MAG: hypothetical protein WC346_18335 [Methanogenium sp.]|jgi:hypothetical protein
MLKNEFTQETRDLFFWNKKCWWCGQNHWNCLHHILGRVSNSPLNAAPIANFGCHIGNGKLSQFEVRKKMLKKTLEYLLENGYVLTEKDKEFKKKYEKYYKS